MPIRFTGCLFLQNYVCLYEAVVYVAGAKVVQGLEHIRFLVKYSLDRVRQYDFYQNRLQLGHVCSLRVRNNLSPFNENA